MREALIVLTMTVAFISTGCGKKLSPTAIKMPARQQRQIPSRQTNQE